MFFVIDATRPSASTSSAQRFDSSVVQTHGHAWLAAHPPNHPQRTSNSSVLSPVKLLGAALRAFTPRCCLHDRLPPLRHPIRIVLTNRKPALLNRILVCCDKETVADVRPPPGSTRPQISRTHVISYPTCTTELVGTRRDQSGQTDGTACALGLDSSVAQGGSQRAPSYRHCRIQMKRPRHTSEAHGPSEDGSYVFTTLRWDPALLNSAQNTAASCHRPCPFFMLEHHVRIHEMIFVGCSI